MYRVYPDCFSDYQVEIWGNVGIRNDYSIKGPPWPVVCVRRTGFLLISETQTRTKTLVPGVSADKKQTRDTGKE